jgi:hypothetical protein
MISALNWKLYSIGCFQIAAILLMYLTEEEDVFWGLSQLMADPKFAMHGTVNGRLL